MAELQKLDLESAWNRVKFDLRHRVFTPTASEEDILDFELDDWLASLRRRLEDRVKAPHPCETIEVPKEGFHIRPGARLDIEDQLVYAALVQEIYPEIRAFLRTSLSPKDYAYLLRDPKDIPWFQHPPFRGWRAFQRVSLERIEKGATYVLVADLAGFYENIDLSRLRYVLNTLKLNDALLDELFKYLRVWADPRGRGIPQGLSASDLLAKVYLESVDRRLEREGFDHVRYVDDIRIFTKSELDAKKALVRLTALLREVGLNLQTKKTAILSAEEARQHIEGSIPEIERLGVDLTRAARQLGFSNPYLTVDDLQGLEEEQASVVQHVLEDAFRDHFLSGKRAFDSSLLHYLLIRLGRLKSTLALDFAIELLASHPEDTEYALGYLAAFKDQDDVVSRVVSFARSADAIYEFQVYQIVRWLSREEVVNDDALGLARHLLNDKSKQFWVRSYAIALLGEAGDAADLESIEAQYAQAQTDLERAILLSALRRMSSVRRNSVYARYAGTSLLTSIAVAWARNKANQDNLEMASP